MMPWKHGRLDPVVVVGETSESAVRGTSAEAKRRIRRSFARAVIALRNAPWRSEPTPVVEADLLSTGRDHPMFRVRTDEAEL
jgi:hypothetical protein